MNFIDLHTTPKLKGLKLHIIAATLIPIFSLPACGGGSDTGVNTATSLSDEPMTLPTQPQSNEEDDGELVPGEDNDDDNDEPDPGDDDDDNDDDNDESDPGDDDDDYDDDNDEPDPGDDDDDDSDEPDPGSDECEEDEDGCEADRQVQLSGYTNPNPIPDNTVFEVPTEAANQAARFLAHATFGASYPLITQVANQGEALWLEEQFQQPVGDLFSYTDYLVQRNEVLNEENPNNEEIEPLGSPWRVHMLAWLTQTMTAPDLVRQRVTFALSEIFVISSNVEVIGESPYLISHFHDTLLTNSFGNYRDLLRDVTLSPAMAIYLSHLNNSKENPQAGTFPDENYAREVMQLFSIGLFELNPDGSRKKDANGQDIPTYGQTEIREFAKIFTGLGMDIEGFGFVPGGNDDFYQYAATLKPLTMYEDYHQQGEKHLLNGHRVPAGQTGMQDIESAIDNLFNHPNVGPFIGKQLIQRLVTSNPSPEYIARVTSAFNGKTGSPRGDMKALLRAILLDPEALQATAAIDNTHGRLREPFLRLIQLQRAFEAQTPDRNFAIQGWEINERLKQFVYSSPSVFNFFQPHYAHNGEVRDNNLVAPEFQITNSSTIIEIKNLIFQWMEAGALEEAVGNLPQQVVTFEHELSLASNSDALLDRLDTLMTYGTLRDSTRSLIKDVIDGEENPELKVRKAIYLLAISPDFAIAL